MAIRLSSPELLRDPYGVFGRLRGEEPVAVLEQFFSGPAWLVTRYDDVVAVLKDARFSNERHKIQSNNLWTVVAQVPNAIAMNHFFHQLISARRKQPTDDLISALVQAEEQGDRLNEDELSAMLFLLLLAGHETTVNLIGSGTLALLEHPDALEQLQANPDLLDSSIEEMLRFTNPVQYIAPRYALEDIDLHGQRVPKGSTVMVAIASANRDETVFENPDLFDITRTPNRHVAFGQGIHYCLGAPLARLEAKIAFQTLFRRYPNLKLGVSPALRGLVHLPVRLA